METTGLYKYDTSYNPEIYTLVALSAGISITLILAVIYYHIKMGGLKFNKSEVIVNIMLSAGFMSGFLCVFYFTYLDKVEKDVLINNIIDVFNDIIPENKLTSDMIAIINELITVIKQIPPPATNSNQDIIDNNKKITNDAIKIFGSGFGAVILVATGIMIYYKLSLFKIFGINLILLASIAIIEFIFATMFVSNYGYIDLNNVIYDGLAVYQKWNPYLHKKNNPKMPPSGIYYNPFFL